MPVPVAADTARAVVEALGLPIDYAMIGKLAPKQFQLAASSSFGI
ncbi:MAG TPA: hypothetical protein VK747_23945 [Blastocatellia bacterium]|nr:hypothetical protein [Blastocatellia bacterium]